MISEIKEVLDEVFVKEVRDNGIDYVSFVLNVPRTFIYAQTPKMVMKRDKEGYAEGHMVPKHPSELEWTLKPGLEHSASGDGAIMFQTRLNEGREALAALDNYIDRMIPRDIVVPDRTPYPIDPKDPRSNPKPKDKIPKIELPSPSVIEPVSRETAESISPSGTKEPESIRPSRHFTAEHKQKLRDSLVKARAARGLHKNK